MDLRAIFEAHGAAFVYVVFAIAFLSILLTVNGGTVEHESPVGYLAGDAFWHLTYTDALREIGNARYTPEFFGLGTERMVYFQPPLIYHFEAMVADVLGVETYDAMMIGVALLALITGLVLVSVARSLIGDAALLGLGLSLLGASMPFAKVYFWGWHTAVIGQLGLAVVIGVILAWKQVRFASIVLGVILAFTLLAHLDGLVYALGIMIGMFVFMLVFRENLKRVVVPALISVGLVVVIAGVYGIVLSKTFLSPEVGGGMLSAGGGLFNAYDVPWDAEPRDLGIWLFIVIPGAFLAFWRSWKEKDARHLAFVGLLLLSLTLYIGLERIVRFNFALPLLVAPLIGYALYPVLSKVKAPAVIIASIVLIGIAAVAADPLPEGSSMVHPEVWRSMEILRSMGDSPVLYLYHIPGTGQPHAMHAVHRTGFHVKWDEFNGSTDLVPVRASCHILGGAIVWPDLSSAVEKDDRLNVCSATEMRDLCEFEHISFVATQDPGIDGNIQTVAQAALAKGFTVEYERGPIYILERSESCV